MRPKIAVVIPALNEEKYIGGFLTSLFRSLYYISDTDRKSISIIVVDNNSKDRTPEILETFKSKYHNFYILKEKKVGPGYARKTGINFVCNNLVNSSNDDFWIFSCDSDVVVPVSWFSKWISLIKNETKPIIIAGNSKFCLSFRQKYPNGMKVLSILYRDILNLEKMVGVTNADGFNSVFSLDAYVKAGPYKQPQKKVGGKIYNYAGEDWDLSTRARIIGVRIKRNSKSVVINSSRRFESNPEGYLSGLIYESPFKKLDNYCSAKDIENKDINHFISIGKKRICCHYFEKPMLVDNSLLTKPDIIRNLGHNLSTKINEYIRGNKIPDFIVNRNNFIEYLLKFHEKFGEKIKKRLL